MTRDALVADVRLRRGALTLDAALAVEPGRVLAVLGPNGAGKSTLLDVLAGLLAPDDGEVRTGGRVLSRRHRGAGDLLVPPERRSVGLLGQDPLVFPHLSARDNVAFAGRAHGLGARAARADADDWLARVGLDGLGDRRPADLSGGQRQRVALARALAARPCALLLDEPFAQLDVRTAAALRDVVRQQVRATATAVVLVTHDALDALTLADDLLVLVDGTVVERGVPAQVLADPAHAFTAALAGTNLLVGTVAGAGDRTVLATADGLRVPCPPGLAAGTRAQLTFPPNAVTATPGARPDPAPAVPHRAPGGAVAWQACVVDLEPGTTGVRVRTTGDVLVDVPPASLQDLDLRVGAPLTLTVPREAQRLRAHP
ncbi:ABC transporter ATP-binding protein [Cellulomonas fimi]|uniref:ABC transporter related protein n=1 Tax=Cellulomonas fimi (strain ATCC 484 / DSM 20113 / JCM 1341 / CCUG 24087 / LMG 16345 / NBRC 15513 / NCIMB 8980 / NCTC 7547 / NRS-133) TaxID=590998 RepID=F4H439_CELFA|nr:ABC transporter ATP-binding protein [Cellulomonas fimi]AEE45391.1 ABC transporter related protein [Cellulomonas fimi ATCC 484]NNH06856.1 ABC transporter ATP-binding protein [Cellulomonas fimi]VEH29227.1 Sulfate/thiosulfate import ATP-binding protein CysA [Cellulomonas fimi]